MGVVSTDVHNAISIQVARATIDRALLLTDVTESKIGAAHTMSASRHLSDLRVGRNVVDGLTLRRSDSLQLVWFVRLGFHRLPGGDQACGQ